MVWFDFWFQKLKINRTTYIYSQKYPRFSHLLKLKNYLSYIHFIFSLTESLSAILSTHTITTIATNLTISILHFSLQPPINCTRHPPLVPRWPLHSHHPRRLPPYRVVCPSQVRQWQRRGAMPSSITATPPMPLCQSSSCASAWRREQNVSGICFGFYFSFCVNFNSGLGLWVARVWNFESLLFLFFFGYDFFPFGSMFMDMMVSGFWSFILLWLLFYFLFFFVI